MGFFLYVLSTVELANHILSSDRDPDLGCNILCNILREKEKNQGFRVGLISCCMYVPRPAAVHYIHTKVDRL